jgi:hypothetical protein
MAGTPHYRNSRVSMNKWEPEYLSQFEIIITPPPGISNWSLVMENVSKVSGLEINKMPGVVEQKYKSAKRSFAGGAVDNTAIDIQIDFEVNVNDENSSFVYKALRQWCDLVYDPLTGKMGMKKDYAGGPAIINQFQKNGDIYRQIVIPSLFPTSPIGNKDLEFASNDIYKISGFTFRCDFWDETIV